MIAMPYALTAAERAKLIANGEVAFPQPGDQHHVKLSREKYIPKGRGTKDGRPPGTIKNAALAFMQAGLPNNAIDAYATARGIAPDSFRSTIWRLKKEGSQ